MRKVVVPFAEKISPSNIFSRTCWFTLILVSLIVSQAPADEVIIKNGDHLHGEVISMVQGKLIFNTEYAGKIIIDWEKVAHISTKETLEICLQNEKILKGKAVSTDAGFLVLHPESAPATLPITMAQIKTLGRPKPPEIWKLDFMLNVGASKETGNTETEKYNLDGQITLSKSPHVIRLYGEYHKEYNKEKLSKDKGLGSLTYERFITKNWYLFGNATESMDKFQDLNLLANVAAGPGYQFWKSETRNLSVRLGPAYAVERYTKAMKNFDNEDHKDYVAAYWAMDFDMWFFDRFIQLFHHNDGLFDLKDSNNWLFRTRTGLRVPIAFGFFAALQYNYDFNNSPADDKKKNDQMYLFKLGWHW